MSEKEFKVYNLSDVVPDGTQLAQKNFFNFGDWVYIPAINEKGKVIGRHYDKHWEEDSLTLRMQDGRELKVLESNCKLSDYDPKTAFLHDLSELLRKHNAVINASWDEYFDNGYPKIDLDINFNGHVEGICFENVLDLSLTADNLLNYDKE